MAKRWLEEFELHESIGVGTVGAIYRATDLPHGQDVALKILHPTVSDDKLISARFAREMMILEKLSHPHIVRYFGGGREKKQLFYTMELVSGGSLKELLARDERLPWREVATIAVQICSALQHAHNHGIIHRDLKPANLLFTEEGEVKLCDFGIARDANAKTITADGLTVGSYYYMPPEQIQGEQAVTGQADLYALGCVLFEMLAGRPPYQGDNFAQIFEQHLHSAPPRVSDFELSCPQQFDEVIGRLLEKSPQDRPFNARNVQGTIMEILDPTPARATSLAASNEEDVPASTVVEQGRQAVSERLSHAHLANDYQSVSWKSMAAIFFVIVLLICAAWYFGG